MKVILNLDYRKYVMEASAAMTVLEILATAEMYNEEYLSASESPTGTSQTTYHVFTPQKDEAGHMSLRPITEMFYTMAKLAGAPTK